MYLTVAIFVFASLGLANFKVLSPSPKSRKQNLTIYRSVKFVEVSANANNHFVFKVSSFGWQRGRIKKSEYRGQVTTHKNCFWGLCFYSTQTMTHFNLRYLSYCCFSFRLADIKTKFSEMSIAFLATKRPALNLMIELWKEKKALKILSSGKSWNVLGLHIPGT